jgi:hypothetical protein
LILTVFLIRFAWKRWQGALLNAEGARRAALRVAIVVAALSVIGFVIQVLPGFDQVNGYIIALALPLHAGIVAMLVALDPGPVDAGAR